MNFQLAIYVNQVSAFTLILLSEDGIGTIVITKLYKLTQMETLKRLSVNPGLIAQPPLFKGETWIAHIQKTRTVSTAKKSTKATAGRVATRLLVMTLRMIVATMICIAAIYQLKGSFFCFGLPAFAIPMAWGAIVASAMLFLGFLTRPAALVVATLAMLAMISIHNADASASVLPQTATAIISALFVLARPTAMSIDNILKIKI